MLRYLVIAMFLLLPAKVGAQNTIIVADSIRTAFGIPDLSYAIVSADTIFEQHALGVKKMNGDDMNASLNDRFRIGSNTKAVTGYLAALLVHRGKIAWNTKFFDVFPAMKAGARKEYYDLTLLDLLSFRTHLFPYTYTNSRPVKKQFHGSDSAQRYQFAAWFFRQPPVRPADSICFSNLGYVAAGLMLEHASGRSYPDLVAELNASLGTDFRFGQPNQHNSVQTWGHNAAGIPEGPTDDYKLNWLLAAGNINANLTDYLKFIQLQLQGLQGRDGELQAAEYNFLLFGRPQFAVGWFWDRDEHGRPYAWNIGNPGTFLSRVFVYPAANRAVIILSNIQSPGAEDGQALLLQKIKEVYGL